MHRPTCIFWANLTPLSLQYAGFWLKFDNATNNEALTPRCTFNARLNRTLCSDLFHSPLRWTHDGSDCVLCFASFCNVLSLLLLSVGLVLRDVALRDRDAQLAHKLAQL